MEPLSSLNGTLGFQRTHFGKRWCKARTALEVNTRVAAVCSEHILLVGTNTCDYNIQSVLHKSWICYMIVLHKTCYMSRDDDGLRSVGRLVSAYCVVVVSSSSSLDWSWIGVGCIGFSFFRMLFLGLTRIVSWGFVATATSASSEPGILEVAPPCQHHAQVSYKLKMIKVRWFHITKMLTQYLIYFLSSFSSGTFHYPICSTVLTTNLRLELSIHYGIL